MEPDYKISCFILVKNGADHIEKTILSLQECGLDELVICDNESDDDTVKICSKYADKIVTYVDPSPLTIEVDGEERVVLSDFAAARNFATEACSHEYVFWMDSDDILHNPVQFKRFIDENVRTGRADAVRMSYDYTHDENGQCTLRHPQDRLFRKDRFVWKSPIHEVICALTECEVMSLSEDISRIIHKVRTDDYKGKAKRNFAISEKHLEKNKGNVEPRLMLNHARSLRALGRYEEAIPFIRDYLDTSTWNEERYFSFLLLAHCFESQGVCHEAISAAFRAIDLFPSCPDAYHELARYYYLAHEPEKALFWLDHSEACEGRISYHDNPVYQESGSDRLRAFIYVELQDFRKSLEFCNKALKKRPWDNDLRMKKVLCSRALRESEVVESYRRLEFMLELEGDEEKMSAFRFSTPSSLHNRPEINVPLKVDGSKPRIAILCYETPTTWGYNSASKGGVGGSETAVIYMAKELAKVGWSVEVYGLPSEEQEGLHDGVIWMPYWRIRHAPPPQVLVAWRAPGLLELCPGAEKKYVWLHDVQQKERWRDSYVKDSEAIIFLSKAHRKTAPWIPDEKVWYSENGLDPSFHHDGLNDPHRLIYASCPSRGLDVLLPMWPEIKHSFPKAVLDIYYGFTPTFVQHMKSSPGLRKVYDNVHKSIQQDGVNWHGMVSQDELKKSFSSCGIWAYPSSFYEISCITAMQAQANGSIPVTTGFAALSETVEYGSKYGETGDMIADNPSLLKEYKEGLLHLMGSPSLQSQVREDMVLWARNRFLWSQVAKSWDSRFREDLSLLTRQTTPLVAMKQS